MAASDAGTCCLSITYAYRSATPRRGVTGHSPPGHLPLVGVTATVEVSVLSYG